MLDSRGYAVPAGAARHARDHPHAHSQRTVGRARLLAGRRGRQRRSHGHDAPQALAPYQNSTHVFTVTDKATGTTVERTVSEAIELALGALACQMENGGFGDDGESSRARRRVIIALCALGIDPATDARFCQARRRLCSSSCALRQAGRRLCHTLEKGADGSNAMAGEQALGALTAYSASRTAAQPVRSARGSGRRKRRRAVRALREGDRRAGRGGYGARRRDGGGASGAL